MSAPVLLFVGGTRSGKSGLAQRWVEAQAPCRLYLATCRVEDAEMAARVARHQAQRCSGWLCLEEALDPVGALARFFSGSGAAPAMPGALLLDCVSLWVANLLAQGLSQDAVLDHVERLALWLGTAARPMALVSAETGLGMTPMSSVGRNFQDTLGLTNQRLARACGTVIFVSCGLPLVLKGRLPEEIC